MPSLQIRYLLRLRKALERRAIEDAKVKATVLHPQWVTSAAATATATKKPC